MDLKLELVLIPVSDADRAKTFYLEQAGFDLLVDVPTGLPGQRVVQVTPPGSACSIGFGTGITAAEPGSQQGLHLVVPDIIAARAELAARGVKVSEVRHIANGAWTPGPDPNRANYMSFAEFSDPDGNLWLLQEVRRGQDGQEGDDR
jgi:catechol 2,3-dioxygenase-like lactoylglutathione lyase family enzyme